MNIRKIVIPKSILKVEAETGSNFEKKKLFQIVKSVFISKDFCN